MIFRLSQKLAAKLKVIPSEVLPLDPNPYADWSAHLFVAARTQFVMVTNTASLYSTVMYGRGITNDSQFLDRALNHLREFMADDGQEFFHQQLFVPVSGSVHFSKALNRSVTGSMSDLIFHARVWLTEGELSPHDTSFKLNNIPMSSLGYRQPREVFKSLVSATADVSRPRTA